ncbi:hypothetical protein HOC11_01385 [archaeon]|jgi:hypothetical protein|nr:hypothetical protein [archaeon]
MDKKIKERIIQISSSLDHPIKVDIINYLLKNNDKSFKEIHNNTCKKSDGTYTIAYNNFIRHIRDLEKQKILTLNQLDKSKGQKIIVHLEVKKFFDNLRELNFFEKVGSEIVWSTAQVKNKLKEIPEGVFIPINKLETITEISKFYLGLVMLTDSSTGLKNNKLDNFEIKRKGNELFFKSKIKL